MKAITPICVDKNLFEVAVQFLLQDVRELKLDPGLEWCAGKIEVLNNGALMHSFKVGKFFGEKHVAWNIETPCNAIVFKKEIGAIPNITVYAKEY
jgi:hypothetical protein